MPNYCSSSISALPVYLITVYRKVKQSVLSIHTHILHTAVLYANIRIHPAVGYNNTVVWHWQDACWYTERQLHCIQDTVTHIWIPTAKLEVVFPTSFPTVPPSG